MINNYPLMHYYFCNIEKILKLKNLIASLYQTDYICTRKKQGRLRIYRGAAPSGSYPEVRAQEIV
jgi:hypothetical protein